MITENELKQAIAECHGERNPNANTCVKLAAFYTIQDHLFGTSCSRENNALSFSASPEPYAVSGLSESEFSKAIDGKTWGAVFPVLDELAATLSVLCPRLYRGLIAEIKEK